MTDQRLQALSRAARLDPAREPELLRERVRAGDLTPERLELAAYVGRVPARVALSWPDVPPRERALAQWLGDSWRELDLSAWVRGLSRWGAETQVRAAVAACEAAWGEWKGSRYCLCMGSNINPPWRECTNCGGTGDHDPRPRYALRAADAWLACPCEEHLPGNLPSLYPALLNEGATRCFYRLLCCLPSAFYGWNTGSNGAEDAVVEAARLATPEAVRTAIQQALTSWALG